MEKTWLDLPARVGNLEHGGRTFPHFTTFGLGVESTLLGVFVTRVILVLVEGDWGGVL